MSTKYFAGKWNDHDIVFIMDNSASEIRLDGKTLKKEAIKGIVISVSLSSEISDLTDDLSVFVRYGDGKCACIVGKKLETTYDKETKTFSAEYNGHKIEGNNKKLKGRMLIDGEEVDKEDSGMHSYAILGSGADENGKRIMAVFEAGTLKVNCQMYAEAENVKMYPCERQGGELIPITSNGEDNFATGFVLGMMIN